MNYTQRQKYGSYLLVIVAIAASIILALSLIAAVNDDRSSRSSINIISTDISEVRYLDGTFTSRQSYIAGVGKDVLDISLELDSGVVKSVNIKKVEIVPASSQYINAYASEIKTIEGANLDDINNDSVFVSGASFTSVAFQRALEEIKIEALK